MYVAPGGLFHLLVENFSGRGAHLKKHMLVAVGSGTPQYMVHMTDDNFDWDEKYETYPMI